MPKGKAKSKFNYEIDPKTTITHINSSGLKERKF